MRYSNDNAPAALKGPFKIQILRSLEGPVPVRFLFLPEGAPVAVWCLRCAKAMVLAGALMLHAPGLTGQQGPTLCGGEPASRWATAGAHYSRGSVAGKSPETWLESITGLVVAGGRVYVHDGTLGRIHVLSAQLQPVSQFGRLGGGPGEFASLPMLGRHPLAHYTSNTLTADDSLLHVYDGRRLQRYRHDGKYVDSFSGVPAPMQQMRIRRLAARQEGVYFGYDSISFPSGERQLVTFRTGPTGKVLIQSNSILRLTQVENHRIFTTDRDPQPLWTMAGGCIVWADGVNHRFVRTRVHDGDTDTVRLPEHKVPPDDFDHATASKLAESMGSPPPPRRPRDAPLWHWSGLIVDPDGHIWVRPWTRSGRPEGIVYRVDPWGRVHMERVPAFPEAFGAPGVFYARDKDPDTDEILLVRYQKER